MGGHSDRVKTSFSGSQVLRMGRSARLKHMHWSSFEVVFLTSVATFTCTSSHSFIQWEESVWRQFETISTSVVGLATNAVLCNSASCFSMFSTSFLLIEQFSSCSKNHLLRLLPPYLHGEWSTADICHLLYAFLGLQMVRQKKRKFGLKIDSPK